MRTEKYFLALKCLLAAFAIDSSDAVAHEQTLRFFFRRKLDGFCFNRSFTDDFAVVSKESSETSSPVLSLATSSLPKVYSKLNAQASSVDLLEVNEEATSNQPKSAAHIFASVRVRQMLDSTATQVHCDSAIEALDGETLNLEDALECLRLLKELGAEKDMLEKAAEKTKARFPKANLADKVIGGEFQ